MNENSIIKNLHNLSKIRIKRLSLGYSQEYMAFHMGISQKSYSNIETGKTKINYDTQKAIAEILNIKPCDICIFKQECLLSIFFIVSSISSNLEKYSIVI